MSKRNVIFLIIICVVSSWLFELIAGRYLIAKISTLPVLNKLKILSPQAPIVITERATVRVSDGTDTVQAAAQVKAKISTIALTEGSDVSITGSAINLTSDGNFVTAASSLAKPLEKYSLVLSDGRVAKINSAIKDPATSLVFFKTDLNNVSTANFGDSKNLAPGEKILFVKNSLQSYLNSVAVGYVVSAQNDLNIAELKSDYPRRSFGGFSPSALLGGEAVANTNGEIVGVWNGEQIISSDVLKNSLALYFKDSSKISRPSLGLVYKRIYKNLSSLSGLNEGVLVVSVNFPASLTVLPGDVITSVDETAITGDVSFEELLQNYKPGDKIKISVVRGKQVLNLTLTAAELK